MASVNTFRQLSIKERPKVVKILSTGNQFHGATPEQITLKALHDGIDVATYQWYRDNSETVYGVTQNLTVANNQVSTVTVIKVVITATNGVEYEDTLSISKVIDGESVVSQLPVQREWIEGDVYYNNETRIDYIYHRATNSWWRLREGFNEITSEINPSSQFMQLNSLEQITVNLLITENANIAGFVFKDNKMISPFPSIENSNLILDGTAGQIDVKRGHIGSFEIDDDGLYYNDSGFKNIEGQLYPYKNDFLINTNGFKVTSDDLYNGQWCFENAQGAPFCSSTSSARVKWGVETGDQHYAVKIWMDGMFHSGNHKGALWVSGLARNLPAILVDKGGIKISNGNIELEKGHISGMAASVFRTNTSTDVGSRGFIVAINSTNIIITLPPNPTDGRTVCIKRASTGNVTISGNGKSIWRSAAADPSISIFATGDMMMLFYDGVYWQANKMGI